MSKIKPLYLALLLPSAYPEQWKTEVISNEQD